MKVTYSISYIDVLGYIWMPRVMCSQRIKLTTRDMEALVDDAATPTRDLIADWLTMHTGDFSQVVDFAASLEWKGETFTFDWSTEDNEMKYMDTIAEDYE